jgi:hypothetical protein
MPRRASKKKEDFAETAFRVFQEAIGEREKTVPPQPRPKPDPATASAAAAALSALGASKGGKARAASMTDRQRKAVARKAAAARWHQNKHKPRSK